MLFEKGTDDLLYALRSLKDIKRASTETNHSKGRLIGANLIQFAVIGALYTIEEQLE